MDSTPDPSPNPKPSPGHRSQQDIGSNPGQALGHMGGGQAINISGGRVIFQDGQGNSLPPEEFNKKREIPSLLPYLPNRTEQEFELGQAIQRLNQQPLICLVHGNEWQSQDKFLERLRKVSLPRLLKQTTIKEYHLRWPASLNQAAKIPSRLLKNLADEVENDSYATAQQINQTFGKYPGPVLVHLHLLTDDWHRMGPELLTKILEFWQDWPNLGSEQTLVVCILIKYRMKRSTVEKKRRWFFNPFAWVKKFLRQHRWQKLNQIITQQLEDLAKSDFKTFNRFTGTVLPKLDNINRNHVEDWVRLQDTKTFVGEAVIGQLLRAVGQMFAQDETMSMDRVAARLEDLLKDIVLDGREVG